MLLKDKVFWEKIADSHIQGWDRVVLRLAENLADLTEKKINDGVTFNLALEESIKEAVRISGLRLDKKELSRKLINESFEVLIIHWEYGKYLQKWLRSLNDVFLFIVS